jgi:hypothetical protein
VSLIPGATVKQAFQQASSVPFSLVVNDELADNQEGVDLSPVQPAGKYRDQLHRERSSELEDFALVLSPSCEKLRTLTPMSS